MSVDEIVAAAKNAEAFGANEFSIVTSGTALDDRKEMETLKAAIRRIKSETRLEACCSLGLMSKENLLELKEAGLDRVRWVRRTPAAACGGAVMRFVTTGIL